MTVAIVAAVIVSVLIGGFVVINLLRARRELPVELMQPSSTHMYSGILARGHETSRGIVALADRVATTDTADEQRRALLKTGADVRRMGQK